MAACLTQLVFLGGRPKNHSTSNEKALDVEQKTFGIDPDFGRARVRDRTKKRSGSIQILAGGLTRAAKFVHFVKILKRRLQLRNFFSQFLARGSPFCAPLEQRV